MNRRYRKHQTETKDYHRARELRHDSSQIEQKFWFALRQAAAARRLKFRRQQPIHPYIADFACMKAKLLIELDGLSHDARLDYDQKRDAYLRKHGYKVMRLTNEEIVENLAGAVEAAILRVEKLLNSRSPLTSKN